MTEEMDFAQFKTEFFKISGLDLDSYKNQQMERRVRHLVNREGYGGFCSFLEKLGEDPAVLHKFLNYVTINTSSFFRDTRVYDYLRNSALAELLERHERIKIWSMGCSRGEEPYSVAIILNELSALDRADILASDIDDKARAMAEEGRFAPYQVDKVPPPLLATYFARQINGHYLICDRIKKAVTFARHNFLAPACYNRPPMHLVLCRNVFIYFKPDVQERIVERVAGLITGGGFFVVGCAEFVNNPQRFHLERKIPAVYQKLA